MDDKHLFDVEAYFRDLAGKNRLARDKEFFFCTCSGIETLEGALQNFRTEQAFFCVEDTNDGALVRSRNGGWFKRRTMTVFLLHRHKPGDMADRSEKLAWCRELFRQVISKMIVDKDDLSNELVYLRTESVLSREFGQYVFSGCTGLYFMVDVDEPLELIYTRDEWL